MTLTGKNKRATQTDRKLGLNVRISNITVGLRATLKGYDPIKKKLGTPLSRSRYFFFSKEAEIIGEHRFLVSLLQNYYCLKHPEKVSFTRVKIRESDQALSFSWQTEQFSRQFFSALNDLTQGKTRSMPDIFEFVSSTLDDIGFPISHLRATCLRQLSDHIANSMGDASKRYLKDFPLRVRSALKAELGRFILNTGSREEVKTRRARLLTFIKDMVMTNGSWQAERNERLESFIAEEGMSDAIVVMNEHFQFMVQARDKAMSQISQAYHALRVPVPDDVSATWTHASWFDISHSLPHLVLEYAKFLSDRIDPNSIVTSFI